MEASKISARRQINQTRDVLWANIIKFLG